MKLMIWLGIMIGGTVGGGFGNLLDHQSFFSLSVFGGWAIVMTGVGSLVGIWAGFKIGKNYF